MEQPNALSASALLGREPSADLIREIARLALDLHHPSEDCPRYLAGLDHALEAEPPPFGTREYSVVYHQLALEPRWMAVSLLTNAEREGDGSTRLWSLAACSTDAEHQRLLKLHACDESRHALMYVALFNLSFPGAASPEFANELRKLSPGFSKAKELFPIEGSPYAKEPTVDDFLQMNVAEIRTAIHHTMQRGALARHCPASNQAKATKVQDTLLSDELRHIAYTAVLIEKCTQHADPGRVESLFARRFRDFNAITTEELGGNVFDCSVACCAKRPSCRAKTPRATPEPVLLQVGSSQR